MASVPRINESFSAWNGFAGRSYGMPLTFTAVRTGRDHTPRAPPIAWSLRFVRVGRSRYPAQQGVNVLVSGEFDWRDRGVIVQTWKSVKPPSESEPVAVTSSGTKRSCGEDYTGRSLAWWRRTGDTRGLPRSSRGQMLGRI